MKQRVFLWLLILLAAFPDMSARAENRIPAIKPIIVTYDVYIGGIHLLTADVLFEEGKTKYHALVNGHTYGLLYKVFPWNTELDAEGQVKQDHFVPTEYVTHNLWGKKAKMTKLTFVKGDVKAFYDPPETNNDPNKMTPAQKEGALDPVTALLQMLAHVAVEKNCDVTVPVFDGRRRFDVTGSDSGTEYIDEADYGIYKGEARTCDAKFTAISGEWDEKVKERFWKKSDDGEDREPFHIWLASVAPGMPEAAVRIETGSVWGDVVMHLSKWRYATPEDGVKMLKDPVVKKVKTTKEAVN